jgi:hypothetical protein
MRSAEPAIAELRREIEAGYRIDLKPERDDRPT